MSHASDFPTTGCKSFSCYFKWLFLTNKQICSFWCVTEAKVSFSTQLHSYLCSCPFSLGPILVKDNRHLLHSDICFVISLPSCTKVQTLEHLHSQIPVAHKFFYPNRPTCCLLIVLSSYICSGSTFKEPIYDRIMFSLLLDLKFGWNCKRFN